MNQIKEINRRENIRKKSVSPTTNDAPNPLWGGWDGGVPVQNIQPTSPCKPMIYTTAFQKPAQIWVAVRHSRGLEHAC